MNSILKELSVRDTVVRIKAYPTFKYMKPNQMKDKSKKLKEHDL